VSDPPVRYDFDAAGELAFVLIQVYTTLKDLVDTRDSLQRTDLTTAGQWKGRNRDRFDADFAVQRAALKSLLDQVDTARAAVQRATAQAFQAQRLWQAQQRTGA
jgi:hypothetical protein